MRFFIKENVQRAVLTAQGWPVPFEDVGDGYGILATNDPYTIGQLEILTKSANPKGVVEVASQEELDAIKKKAQARHSYKASTSPRKDAPRLVVEPLAVSPATNANPAPIHDPSIVERKKVGEVLSTTPEIKAPKAKKGRPAATKAIAEESAPV